jgi:glutathione S-transferase
VIKLYGHEISGNSYKVRLMLSLLDLQYQWVKVDLLQGEHKSAAYLAINSFGQVPTLIDKETIITDAQAILVYLAAHYGDGDWLPSEPLNLSRVVRWLSITAGELRQGLEDARLYHLFGAGTNINIDYLR